MHVKVEFTEGYEKRFTEACCRVLARRERQGIGTINSETKPHHSLIERKMEVNEREDGTLGIDKLAGKLSERLHII